MIEKLAVIPTCGVKPDLYSNYKLEDHQWKNPIVRNKKYCGHNLTPLFDSLLEFSKRIIKVDGSVWMKTGTGGVWIQKSTKADAVKDAINHWQHEVIGSYTVDKEFIDIFFDGVLKITEVDEDTGKPQTFEFEIGSCPQFSGIIMIPFGTDFISYKGKKYLNTWINRRTYGDAAHKVKGKIILRLIYRSICAGEPLDADASKEMDILEEQVLTDKFTNNDFRFALHWLAGIYQRPGVNLLTNLWLCGYLQGVGKGTLAQLMKLLLGSNLTTLLDQSEVERGWTKGLMGAVLVEVDELDTSGKGSWSGKKWENWIKDKTIKDEANFTERNVGNHEVINIANYFFTMNDEMPVYCDKSDRRNYFIKTTDDAQWIRYAAEIQEQMMKVNAKEVAAGFGYYLERLDVDWRFINKGHNNEFKQSIQNMSMGEVEEWISLDDSITRKTWAQASTLYDDYVTWSRKHVHTEEPVSLRKFGLDMTSLAKKKQFGVESRIATGNVKQYKIDDVIVQVIINGDQIASSLSTFLSKTVGLAEQVPNYDAPIIPIIADFSKMSKMDKLRAKLKTEKEE